MKIYHLPYCGYYNELGYTVSACPGCVCGPDGIESPEEDGNELSSVKRSKASAMVRRGQPQTASE